jgi:hypothetical protein
MNAELVPVAIAPQDRVQATFDSLRASGALLETEAFLERSGWSREALDNAVAAHHLFRIAVGGVSAYPAFYLDTRYDRRELESVIELLGDLPGGSKWLFFTKPKASLSAPLAGSPTARARAGEAPTWPVPTEGVYIGPSGEPRTPLQALEAGELLRVQRTAAAYAQR